METGVSNNCRPVDSAYCKSTLTSVERGLLNFLLADFSALKSEIARRSQLQKLALALFVALIATVAGTLLRSQNFFVPIVGLWLASNLALIFWCREQREILRLGNLIKDKIAERAGNMLNVSKEELVPSEGCKPDKCISKETHWYRQVFMWLEFFIIPMLLTIWVVLQQLPAQNRWWDYTDTVLYAIILIVICAIGNVWLLCQLSAPPSGCFVSMERVKIMGESTLMVSPQVQEQLLEEYRQLRAEILAVGRIILHLILVTITVAFAIVGAAIQTKEPWLAVMSMSLVLSSLIYIKSRVSGMTKLGAYIQHRIESKLPGLRWEHAQSSDCPLDAWPDKVGRVATVVVYLVIYLADLLAFNYLAVRANPPIEEGTCQFVIVTAVILMVASSFWYLHNIRSHYEHKWSEWVKTNDPLCSATRSQVAGSDIED